MAPGWAATCLQKIIWLPKGLLGDDDTSGACLHPTRIPARLRAPTAALGRHLLASSLACTGPPPTLQRAPSSCPLQAT